MISCPARFGSILTAVIVLSPVGRVDADGAKFMGVATCSTTDCHGAPQSKEKGRTISNEFTTWINKDKHAQSVSNLGNKVSLEIVKKLGIKSGKESERCLSCHAVKEAAGDPSRQGPKFDLASGNSCEDCHGASEKWLDPHSKTKPEHKSWTREQSIAAGMYDALDLVQRGEKCVSCHLKIDHELMAAGHPKMTFEMDLYQAMMPPHWVKEKPVMATRAWAVGQILCLREALAQLVARVDARSKPELVDEAYRIASSYHAMTRIVGGLLDSAIAARIDEKMKAVDSGMQPGAVDPGKVKTGVSPEMTAALKDLATKAGGFTPDPTVLKRLLTTLASDTDCITRIGFHGATQLALGLDSVFRVYAKESKLDKPKKDASGKFVKALLQNVSKQEVFKPDVFVKGMQDFAGSL